MIDQILAAHMNESQAIIPEFGQIIKGFKVFEAVFGLPGRDCYAGAKAWLGLAGEVLEEFAVDGVTVGDNFCQGIGGGKGAERASEVGLAGDGGKIVSPLMGGCIANLKLVGLAAECVAAGREPVEIYLAVFDHTGFKIGAIDIVTHEKCFLKNYAGATERVEYGLARSVGREVGDDLG